MRFKLVFFAILFFYKIQLLAQIDNNAINNATSEEEVSKKFYLENIKKAEKPNSIELKGNIGFKSAYKNEKIKADQAENDLSNQEILTRERLAEERYLKNNKLKFTYPIIDQDLGTIRTNAANASVLYRDFRFQDGDIISIFINDELLLANITLQEAYQKITIPLEIGLNKIVFKAENQGTSGPNTAAFKIYDDGGNLLASDKWDLAKGAKATFIIAKYE